MKEIRFGGVGALDMPEVWWPVLGCLLVAPGLRTSRGRLAAQIWPDLDEEASRHCLATALWRIRSKIPPSRDPAGDLIKVTPEGVSLCLGRMWIDALAFERRAQLAIADPGRLAGMAARRQLARGLALYRGDFLADRTEEPLDVERARLRALYLDAMYELALAEARAGDWPRARSATRILCDAEPLREDAQRLLIEAHFRCGNRGLALRQFDVCQELLRTELSVPPMGETLELVESIRACHGASGPAHLDLLASFRPTGAKDDYLQSLMSMRKQLLQTLAVIDASLTDHRDGGDASV